MILRACNIRSSETGREGVVHRAIARRTFVIAAKEYFHYCDLNRFYTTHPQLFHILALAAPFTARFEGYNATSSRMSVVLRLLFGLLALLTLASTAGAAPDATLFRIFLKDGSAVVSYGEFSRVGDRVVFSMPVGGTADQPRLHVVSLPESTVDWFRTDRYSASARYQHYAKTRGESDFFELNNEVARVLNEIALSTDRQRALDIADQARRTLADWPRTHYGYRQEDVREIVALIEEAIAGLRVAGGANAFEVALVATTQPVEIEPVLGLPTPREQLDHIFRVAANTDQTSEKIALLQSALAMLNEAGPAINPVEATALRRSAERQIRDENSIDRRYSQLSDRLITAATKAARKAEVASVERVLSQIAKEDAKLGGKRPQSVQALRTMVEARLEGARRLRLLRDQWTVRRAIYRDYNKLVGLQLGQLVQVQSSLEAIRRLDGPKPDALRSLRRRLSGGSERLQRLRIHEDLRPTHELLVGAWRFAESAAAGRYTAISTGSVAKAWEASSAAAGALMMLARVQQEMRGLLEPPQLQ